MDNMKYYNESLAYDFEMFAPKKINKEEKDNVVSISEARKTSQRKKAAVKSVSSPVAFIICGLFVLCAVFGNISLMLKINEVNANINEIKGKITELESEEVELNVEMQRRISYANLELEAIQLGMKKPDKDNVVYIRVNDKDAAKTSDGKFMVSE